MTPETFIEKVVELIHGMGDDFDLPIVLAVADPSSETMHMGHLFGGFDITSTLFDHMLVRAASQLEQERGTKTVQAPSIRLGDVQQPVWPDSLE